MLASSSIIYALNGFNFFGDSVTNSGVEYTLAVTDKNGQVRNSKQPVTTDETLSAAQTTGTEHSPNIENTPEQTPEKDTEETLEQGINVYLSADMTASSESGTALPSTSDDDLTNTSPSSNGSSTAEPSPKSSSQPESGIKAENKTDDSTVPASVTISAVGDIMAHQSNLNNAYSPKTGKYDFTGFLEYVTPYLSKADLTIGNFETVTAGPKTGYTSYPSFNTPDSILAALSGAGFDILSTANNHCLDRGISGLTRTIQMINKNNMLHVGTSADGSNKYVIREVNGIKLAILAYSEAFNGLDKKLSAEQRRTYLSPVDEQQMQKDIKSVQDAGADAVIVLLHWGTEYQREPNSFQKELAKKLLSWGADIILGSHPHVIQKSEFVEVDGKNKFIIYSMGNFISGYRRVDKANRPNKELTEDGVIVNIHLEKDPEKGTIIKDVDYVPTWVDKYYVNNRPVFKIIPIPDINNISGKYVTDYNKPFIIQSYKNTMGIMAKMK